MAQVLRFDGVTVLRDGRPIVRNLTWTVNEHERWVILGPNGAGKTTVLNVAAAQSFPSVGEVTVLDEVLGHTDVVDLRPRIGMSSPALAERIPTGEKVIDVVLTASYAVLGRFKEEYAEADLARADAQLHALGIHHLADRVYGSLSEGERKRAQLARALMTDPEMMLLDEPGAGLDLGGREDLLTRLTELALNPASPTLIMVTHHVEEIPIGFTHALLIRQGEPVAMGPIRQTLTAQSLADTFGMIVTLDVAGGRYAARAQHMPGVR